MPAKTKKPRRQKKKQYSKRKVKKDDKSSSSSYSPLRRKKKRYRKTIKKSVSRYLQNFSEKNTKLTGKHGIIKLGNTGYTYEGKWRNGNFHGNGILRLNDIILYDGNFKNGKRHGIGISYYNNGDVYHGMWANGIKHGKGFVTKVNGETYTVNAVNDTLTIIPIPTPIPEANEVVRPFTKNKGAIPDADVYLRLKGKIQQSNSSDITDSTGSTGSTFSSLTDRSDTSIDSDELDNLARRDYYLPYWTLPWGF